MKLLNCFAKTLLRFRRLKPYALTSKHRGGVASSDQTARLAALCITLLLGPRVLAYRTRSLGGARLSLPPIALLELALRAPEAKHACRGRKEAKKFIHITLTIAPSMTATQKFGLPRFLTDNPPKQCPQLHRPGV
jgi:hypothetical protein